MNIRFEEFDVPFQDGLITARWGRPEDEKPTKDRMLLCSFAADRTTSLEVVPYGLAAEVFLQQGHQVLSIDLPNHGGQINDYGEGIIGFRNTFVAGIDPFELFVAQGKTVIDSCIARGMATAGQIAVCGTSRGGYMALRLLAADTRIGAGAGFAPVTDWRELKEFRQEKDLQSLASQRLSCYAGSLATRPVFMAIGNHDERVNTARCCQLYLDILASKYTGGYDPFALDSTAPMIPATAATRSGITKGPSSCWPGWGRTRLKSPFTAI